MRCIGDPYGVGSDCLCPSTSFVFGMIPNPENIDEPIVVMCPTCDAHVDLVGDWVAVNNPYGEANGYPWEFFDVVRDKIIEEVGDVFVYKHAAA